MSTTEIKPCQYCRGNGSVELTKFVWSYVECHKCGAEGPHRESAEEAVADWNRVASMAEALKPFTDYANAGGRSGLAIRGSVSATITTSDWERAAALLPPTQAEA